ncbi:MAG: hypothetical protein ACXWV4_07365 [Flavitalea sp.]
MTSPQIAFFFGLVLIIAYWIFIHRKLQRKNQLLVTISAYSLIIIFAWTGSENSWQFALLKTIAFGALAAFNIEELWNLRRKTEEAEESDKHGAS